jgi:hypothetical protein
VVVAKVRERLAVSKLETQNFDMEMFNHNTLNEVEGKENYNVKLSNGFAALENLHDGVDINRGSGTIRENIKLSAKDSLGYSYYELKKQRKPWFDGGC